MLISRCGSPGCAGHVEPDPCTDPGCPGYACPEPRAECRTGPLGADYEHLRNPDYPLAGCAEPACGYPDPCDGCESAGPVCGDGPEGCGAPDCEDGYTAADPCRRCDGRGTDYRDPADGDRDGDEFDRDDEGAARRARGQYPEAEDEAQ